MATINATVRMIIIRFVFSFLVEATIFPDLDHISTLPFQRLPNNETIENGSNDLLIHT
jgi:hypothetical protein